MRTKNTELTSSTTEELQPQHTKTTTFLRHDFSCPVIFVQFWRKTGLLEVRFDVECGDFLRNIEDLEYISLWKLTRNPTFYLLFSRNLGGKSCNSLVWRRSSLDNTLQRRNCSLNKFFSENTELRTPTFLSTTTMYCSLLLCCTQLRTLISVWKLLFEKKQKIFLITALRYVFMWERTNVWKNTLSWL